MTSLSAPVPPVPAEVRPASVAWLRASVSRFSNGPDHARRRALAVSALAGVDVEALRHKAFEAARRAIGDGGDVMAVVARPVPVAVLAGELGLAVRPPDVVTVAAAYHPHVVPDAAAEAALGRLLAACGGIGEPAAARIGLLVQACDATAGLIGNALMVAFRGPGAAVAETLRSNPPVLRTRRRIGGSDVFVELAGTPFGAGPRECPGARHAIALATGVLQALDGFRLTDPEPAWVPSPNLRMPSALWVTRDRTGGRFC
ncbi:hypothetical protein [Amycolatopsis australiensis]|uniref:Cytochrome P450 n=1 Tax=Amycolatopsis australiensis TaxID=546364 RepID=A0A1K1QT10_9PSEU|nr:hypothetical protein [Amycolatopsis australiensis]SFW63016.1 Cytochrome P450 [Amycolatopsis australiensis]